MKVFIIIAFAAVCLVQVNRATGSYPPPGSAPNLSVNLNQLIAKFGFNMKLADSCESDLLNQAQVAVNIFLPSALQSQTHEALAQVINDATKTIHSLEEDGKKCRYYSFTIEPIFKYIDKIFEQGDVEIVNSIVQLLQGQM